MTNEEMKRAIESLRKSRADFNERMNLLEAMKTGLMRQMPELATGTNQLIRETPTEINQLIRESGTRQERTQQQLDHLDNVVASIAEVTQRNSYNIASLIKLVGGAIEGRNGKSEN